MQCTHVPACALPDAHLSHIVTRYEDSWGIITEELDCRDVSLVAE